MELILIIICIIGPLVFALLGKTHPELISRNRNGQPMDEDGKRFFCDFLGFRRHPRHIFLQNP